MGLFDGGTRPRRGLARRLPHRQSAYRDTASATGGLRCSSSTRERSPWSRHHTVGNHLGGAPRHRPSPPTVASLVVGDSSTPLSSVIEALAPQPSFPSSELDRWRRVPRPTWVSLRARRATGTTQSIDVRIFKRRMPEAATGRVGLRRSGDVEWHYKQMCSRWGDEPPRTNRPCAGRAAHRGGSGAAASSCPCRRPARRSCKSLTRRLPRVSRPFDLRV